MTSYTETWPPSGLFRHLGLCLLGCLVPCSFQVVIWKKGGRLPSPPLLAPTPGWPPRGGLVSAPQLTDTDPTSRSSYWLVVALKYLGQRQGGETWNGHRMAHAHRAWYGNSAEDISVPSTEISTRKKKTWPDHVQDWLDCFHFLFVIINIFFQLWKVKDYSYLP